MVSEAMQCAYILATSYIIMYVYAYYVINRKVLYSAITRQDAA